MNVKNFFDKDTSTLSYVVFDKITKDCLVIDPVLNFDLEESTFSTKSIEKKTIILNKMPLNIAFKTAIGMSLVSMISMEVAMNATDVIFTGGAILTWWVIPLMLIAGFITPLPYNYWRLKALGKGCH